jgi:hypothetical protein
MAIRDWCKNNPGAWSVFPYDSDLPSFYPLVSSGKTGTTACHFAVVGSGALDTVGTEDVRDWVNESLDRYTQNYDGVYRVRSYGKSGICTGVRPGNVRWMLDTLQGVQAGRQIS